MKKLTTRHATSYVQSEFLQLCSVCSPMRPRRRRMYLPDRPTDGDNVVANSCRCTLQHETAAAPGSLKRVPDLERHDPTTSHGNTAGDDQRTQSNAHAAASSLISSTPPPQQCWGRVPHFRNLDTFERNLKNEEQATGACCIKCSV